MDSVSALTSEIHSASSGRGANRFHFSLCVYVAALSICSVAYLLRCSSHTETKTEGRVAGFQHVHPVEFLGNPGIRTLQEPHSDCTLLSTMTEYPPHKDEAEELG